MNHKLKRYIESSKFYYLVVLSLSAGIAFFILPLAYINPLSWAWVQNQQPALLDVATSVAAQQDFMSSGWTFPPGAVHNYGFPVGTSLLQTATPFLPILIAKLISAIFGLHYILQISGLTVFLGYVILGLSLGFLFRLERTNRFVSIIGIVLILSIPKFINSWAEPSLSWIWILIVSYLLYRNAKKSSLKYRICTWFGISAMAASTHTYFSISVIFAAFAMMVEMIISTRRIRPELYVIFATFCGTIFGMWVAGGMGIGFKGSATSPNDVGPYATDILGLLSSFGQSNIIQTMNHQASTEGDVYLGVGLTALLLFALIPHAITFFSRLKNTDTLNFWSLETNENGLLRPRGILITAFVLWLYAVGPSLVFDGNQHRLPLGHKIYMLFSIFRASGRLAWPGMLALTIISLILISKSPSKKFVMIIVISCGMLQFFDLSNFIVSTKEYIFSSIENKVTQVPPTIKSNDIYFLPGYPDPRITPWRSQTFATLQGGGKVHYFAYSGRYSFDEISASIAKSINLVTNPTFSKNSLVFVRSDFVEQFMTSTASRSILVKEEQINVKDWSLFRIEN